MTKKALLVGCNYPGTKAELAGCVNDAFMIKKMLMEHKGFQEEDITMLVDTDDQYMSPTGANIRSELEKMCTSAEPGDTVVFHFSGHGTQVPSDGDDDEADKKDEAICPTDMNLIVDDDLKAIVSKLPDGVDFTFISDCCHSGSMLDHSAVEISGPKAGGGAQLPEPASLTALLGGSRDIDPSEIGVKSRELPVNTLTEILSEKLGRSISSREIRGGLGALFGTQASAFVTQLTGNAEIGKMVGSFLASSGVQQTGASGASSGGLGDFSSMLGGGGGGGGLGGLSSMLGGGGGNSGGGGMASMLGAFASAAGGGSTAAAAPTETAVPPKPDPLSPDKGILITGCQASETSADVRPPGGDAFGALTHTLVSTVNENPDDSYVNVVTKVRAKMVEKNFSQNPCLECSEMNAEKTFIC